MSFWFLTSLLGCFVTGMLFLRYVAPWPLPVWQKTVLFAVFMIAGCGLRLTGYGFERVFGDWFSLYRYSVYFIFIFCVILFTLTVARDIVWSAAVGVSKLGWFVDVPDIRNEKWLYRLNIGTIVLGFLCTAWSFYEGVRIPDVKVVEIPSAKIKQEYKIAVLSDLHIHRVLYPWKILCTVIQTNKLRPDIILLPGDILDDNVAKVEKLLKRLGSLHAKKGIFFVSGNHDFYAGHKDASSEMKKLGFHVVENTGVSVGKDLFVGGIPDYFSSKRFGLPVDAKLAFKDAKPDQYRILMSHSPVEFKQKGLFDLEVSGHTHGGQIFPFHFIVKLFNKYLAGLHEMENGSKIYVSRGAGQWGPQMRFLAPSEITLIKLVPAKEG